MFSHVTIGSNDVDASILFYDALLAPLQITRFWTETSKAGRGLVAGWRSGQSGPALYVGRPFDHGVAGPGNGGMCALIAATRAMVDQAYAAGLAHGGTDEGAPGPRPQYAPDYYGAYLRDPDGNKLHIVHRGL